MASGANRFLDADNAWGNSAGRVAASPAAQQAAAAPVSVPPAAPQAAPRAAASASAFWSGGLGSTLGGIATTAAGVAGGALLFQGIENLFHRNSAGGGASGFAGTASRSVRCQAKRRSSNNYYGDEDRSPLGNPGLRWTMASWMTGWAMTTSRMTTPSTSSAFGGKFRRPG
ncbi:DUF2076 family protein [Cupriavidus basilensis]